MIRNINLSLDADDGTISNSFAMPFGGAYEEELIDWYKDLILPVVTALVETKRDQLLRESGAIGHDDDE